MALFDGILIAPVTEVYLVPRPKRRQLDGLSGVNGLLSQDLGTAGGTIEVSAVLYAEDLASLNAQELTWYGYQAGGQSATFVDNFGNPINNCVLDLYEPAGRIKRAGDGGFIRQARLIFLFFV